MSRATSVVLCSVLALNLLWCAGPGPGNYIPPTEVQITWEALSPEAVQIAADGNVTWINNSDESRAFVIFPAAIAASFTCADLRPYFLQTEDGYRSLPLTSYESERVELPCPLKPGTYDYEIWLMGAGEGGIASGDAGRTMLRGKIVVD